MTASFTIWKFVLIPILMAFCLLMHDWKLIGFYYLGAFLSHMLSKRTNKLTPHKENES